MRTIINHILYRLALVFNKRNKPIMIQGYSDSKSGYLPEVKISNTTFIQDSSKLVLGDHVFIGHYNFIESSHGIEIGEGCQITNFISILTHSSHHSIRMYGQHTVGKYPLKGYVSGSVSIGAFTFIGPHVTIMPGTKIGKGCIIAAYSLVKGEFPEFSIISGNPAMVIGDTRIRDKEFLRLNHELIPFYESWAGKQF
jgi:acetyltransferase-like isoleucine patch superfamily enzyme